MNADHDCIFCGIVAGRLPSTKLYEDDEVLAFMDIGPIVKGHALVIPKAHYDPVTAVPPALLGHLIQVAQQVAGAQVKAFNADGVNLFQANGDAAGQVVPHVHFHVIPRFNDDGHSWNWHAHMYTGLEEMQTFADRIKRQLS